VERVWTCPATPFDEIAADPQFLPEKLPRRNLKRSGEPGSKPACPDSIDPLDSFDAFSEPEAVTGNPENIPRCWREA